MLLSYHIDLYRLVKCMLSISWINHEKLYV